MIPPLICKCLEVNQVRLSAGVRIHSSGTTAKGHTISVMATSTSADGKMERGLVAEHIYGQMEKNTSEILEAETKADEEHIILMMEKYGLANSLMGNG